MNSGTVERWAGSSATRLFQSYHSYGRVLRSAIAYGFDQVFSRWKSG